MTDHEDLGAALAAAVAVDAPPAPSLDTVVRRGYVARRRRLALRAGSASTAAVVVAGVALGLPAIAGGPSRASDAAIDTAAVTAHPSPSAKGWQPLAPGESAPPYARDTASPEPSTRVSSIPGEPVPSPPVKGSTTCTPGPVKDLTDRHARLASMCLPSQLPRWSYRRETDRPSRGGSTFFLSDGPLTYYQVGKKGSGGYAESGGGGSVTMQAFASTTPVLAGTGNFNPGPGGRIGPNRGNSYLAFVRYTTVLGVQGTEVKGVGRGYATGDGTSIGILVHVDNLSIEAYAVGYKGHPATYAQLLGVVNALRWQRADGR